MASFDENGKYIKTNWKAGDKITATKLNKIEESIEAVNDNDISRHVEADARLDALEAKDVAHDKELTNVKNLIADNKAAAELGDYEINSRMTFLENELEEAVAEVNNVAETVDGKINEAVTNVNNVASTVDGKIAQGKADMEAMVAEVEADLEGLHAKDEELGGQLAHIENNIIITPDDFEGNDIEKIQQALDYVVENNINTITLNRSYDLTGGIVYYNGEWAKPPTFKDGRLIKNDTGYMFSRLADNNQSNTPLFLNVTFIGNTENPCYIIDGDKLIRQGFDHCYFRGIGLIKTASYLQSLRLHSCEMSFSPDIFINCSGAYDVSITNNKFEESHHALIKSYSDSTDSPACHALRITNNLIEGYVVEPPIVLSSAYGLAISDNYFESNHYGDIEFITSNGIKTIQGVIENNSFFKSNAMWNIKSHNTGNYVNKLFLNGNISTISSSVDKSFTVGITYANMTNNSLPGGGRLVPVGRDIDTSGVQYEVINKDGYSAIKISPRTNTKSNTIDDLGQSYLVKFSGTFGSSTLYRAVFIGILTIGGNYDSDNSMVCKEARLTHLASTLMQGNTGNASMWDNSYATVTFESTGSNKISTTDSDNIIIKFNKIPYHETYSNGFVTNIEGLLAKSLYLERRMQS